MVEVNLTKRHHNPFRGEKEAFARGLTRKDMKIKCVCVCVCIFYTAYKHTYLVLVSFRILYIHVVASGF